MNKIKSVFALMLCAAIAILSAACNGDEPVNVTPQKQTTTVYQSADAMTEETTTEIMTTTETSTEESITDEITTEDSYEEDTDAAEQPEPTTIRKPTRVPIISRTSVKVPETTEQSKISTTAMISSTATTVKPTTTTTTTTVTVPTTTTATTTTTTVTVPTTTTTTATTTTTTEAQPKPTVHNNYAEDKDSFPTDYNPMENTTYKNHDNDFLNNPEYELVWSDEFDGDDLNRDNWSYDSGYIRNNDTAYFTLKRKENTLVKDGKLSLIGRREEYPYTVMETNPDTGEKEPVEKIAHYTASSVFSKAKQAFKYGALEARIKLPTTNTQTYPAFWTCGQGAFGSLIGWPQCGEVDILEFMGDRDGMYGKKSFMQYETWIIWGIPGNNTGAYYEQHSYQKRKGVNVIDGGYLYRTKSALGDKFMIVGIEWDQHQYRFYCNGVTINTMKNDMPYIDADGAVHEDKVYEEFHRLHYIILNMSFRPQQYGWINHLKDSDFPTTVEFDYIRAFQKPNDPDHEYEGN